jgi:hypothetical protein
MTTGCQCTADPRCPHPSPTAGGICTEHRLQARLAQMRHSPSAAVRATGWLLTQLHQPRPGPDTAEPGRRGPSRAAEREAEPG